MANDTPNPTEPQENVKPQAEKDSRVGIASKEEHKEREVRTGFGEASPSVNQMYEKAGEMNAEAGHLGATVEDAPESAPKPPAEKVARMEANAAAGEKAEGESEDTEPAIPTEKKPNPKKVKADNTPALEDMSAQQLEQYVEDNNLDVNVRDEEGVYRSKSEIIADIRAAK